MNSFETNFKLCNSNTVDIFKVFIRNSENVKKFKSQELLKNFCNYLYGYYKREK